MINSMLPLPGLSPVSGKSVVAKFDGGLLSSDGGVLMLREVEQRLRVADRLAGCIEDQRAPDQITHTLADGNDANSLRADPMFKMAHDLAPSDGELCSQSTIFAAGEPTGYPHPAAHGLGGIATDGRR